MHLERSAVPTENLRHVTRVVPITLVGLLIAEVRVRGEEVAHHTGEDDFSGRRPGHRGGDHQGRQHERDRGGAAQERETQLSCHRSFVRLGLRLSFQIWKIELPPCRSLLPFRHNITREARLGNTGNGGIPCESVRVARG